MRQSINNFKNNAEQFNMTADAIRATWQDSVGEAFYRDIIQPLKNEESGMEAAMETLLSKLEQLKTQIEAI